MLAVRLVVAAPRRAQAIELGFRPALAQDVGMATAEAGAIGANQATAHYALVVNTCLTHKKYRVLR